MKKFSKFAMFLSIAAMAAMFTGCGQVNSHEVGLKLRWGKIDSEPLGPGLHFWNPISTELKVYDAREKKESWKEATFTKDMQLADIVLTVTYAMDKSRVPEIHTQYGEAYAALIIRPVVIEAVKNTIGRWEADGLINGRERATEEINKSVKEKLEGTPVKFDKLVLENIDFSDAFEKAIEEKQIATQEAIKARNRTVQIEEESKQDVIRAEAKAKATLALAKAEAEALEIRGKALKENQDLIRLQAIEKWDGKAPQTLILGDGVQSLINMK